MGSKRFGPWQSLSGVSGPSSSVDNRAVRFNGADGVIQSSLMTIDDSGNILINGVGALAYTADDLYLTNNDADGEVFITAEKTGTGQSTLFHGDPDGSSKLYFAGVKKFETDAEGVTIDDVLKILERSTDPTEPTEGESVIWMSDGTGKGDDGDIMIASMVGGVAKFGTIFDHSAGGAY